MLFSDSIVSFRYVRLAKLEQSDRFLHLDLEFLQQHHLLSPWQRLPSYHRLVVSLHHLSHSSKLRQREMLTQPLCAVLARRRSRILSSGRWKSSSCSETCRSVSLSHPVTLNYTVTYGSMHVPYLPTGHINLHEQLFLIRSARKTQTSFKNEPSTFMMLHIHPVHIYGKCYCWTMRGWFYRHVWDED